MLNRDRLLVRRIQDLLSTQPSSEASSKPKIFKVDQRLRRVNEIAYEPQFVSIGPIHRGKGHLIDTEQLKLRYLQQLLQRRGEECPERYVVELMDLEERARKCYSSFIKLPEGDEFVEMLLLDGVFVIEFLRKFKFDRLRDENDYIFHSTQASVAIKCDLVLMENQLPFLVLSKLFGMTKQKDLRHDDLNYLLLHAIESDSTMPFQEEDVNQYALLRTRVHSVDDHLLGLLYEAYICGRPNKSKNASCVGLKSTTSELLEAGVEFKTTNRVNLTNVSFADGVLQLPKFQAYDNTEIILSNLVAHEQMINSCRDPHKYVTDYIFLMTSLVKSAKDVEILRCAGVIENWLRDDEAVHVLINKLGKHIIVHGYFYADIIQSLNDHCGRRRNKWIASLRRNYFNTPWATMSVIAAIVLLLLTTIQTVFTILPSGCK